jgi:hypothetical protein
MPPPAGRNLRTLRTRCPATVVRHQELEQHRRRLTRSGSGERIYLHFVFNRVVKVGKVFTGDVGHFPPVSDFICAC